MREGAAKAQVRDISGRRATIKNLEGEERQRWIYFGMADCCGLRWSPPPVYNDFTNGRRCFKLDAMYVPVMDAVYMAMLIDAARPHLIKGLAVVAEATI